MKSLSLFTVLSLAAATICLPAHAESNPHEEQEHAPKEPEKAEHSAAPAQHAGPHWEYGASDWGLLSPEFSACLHGTAQSPIDVDGAMENGLSKPEFAYKSMAMEVVNNGHTMQVTAAPGSMLNTGMGETELKQFHFHTPSEHFLKGKRYPLEMHLVHKNAQGQLSVVGVFFEEGAANPILAEILKSAPKEPGNKSRRFNFNPHQLVAAETDYVRYSGSLTTPPCSEQVNWYVTTTPMQASAGQIAEFNALMHNNARPMQPRNNRLMIRSGTVAD